MQQLLYINWHPNIIALSLGPIHIRWYSLCWLLGLGLAYLNVQKTYKQQNIKDELFQPLFFYCFIGILIGARLGHCLFYQPDYFLSSPRQFIEMILPIHFNESGGFNFTGYEGLASHGGTIGLIITLYLYYRKTHLNLWTVLDIIAIATPITACFIRLGNLMNSEIIGKPTDLPWAFIFERIDLMPRHPGQLYEAIAYAILLIILRIIYNSNRQRVGSGYFFGLCLTYIFTARFFIEFTKDVQVGFEEDMALNMGQLLSIPLIIIGLICMKGGNWMRRFGAK